MILTAAEILGSERTLNLYKPPSVLPEKMNLVYFSQVYSADEAAFKSGSGIQMIRFQNGRMYIDDLPILKPYFGSDLVTWKQQTKDRFTSGHLFIAGNGTALHGMVYLGSSAADAVQHDVLATTTYTSAYSTQITTSRHPLGTDPKTIPASEWQPGLALTIGYRQGVGHNLPTPVVTLDEQDITDDTTWSIDRETGNTILQLVLSSDACSFDESLYMEGSVEFDIQQVNPTFSGTLSSICSDQSGTGVYLWKGQCDPQSASVKNDNATARPQSTMNFNPLNLTESDLLENDGLSIGELMSIVPDDSVSKLANTILVENMKWAISQSSTESVWLTEFFGEQPPVIPASQQALTHKSLDWYQGDFAKSYLGWSMANYAGPNAPTVKLNDQQKLKLKQFMQTGMARDKDFNIQQSGVFLNAFVQAKPRLQAYVNDTAENWARQLYHVITTPPQMILMINRISGAAGIKGTMSPANNFATLLTVMQPSGELAQKYMKALLSATLIDQARKTTVSDKDLVMQWLPDFLQEFLDQVADSQTVPDEAQETAAQIREMMQQMGGSISSVAEQLADVLVNANGSDLLQKTQTAETAFIEKFPKFAKVGQMLFFAAWCMGVVMLVKAFQNWKDMTPKDKARTVISAVTLGLEGLEVVPKFIQGVRALGLEGWNKLKQWYNSPKSTEQVSDLQEEIDPNWVETGVNETTELLDASTNTIKAEGTLWDAICSGAAKIIGVVGVVASAAFAVLSTMDFVKDIESGQPITKDIFDGIIMATNIAMTFCLVLDLVVASTVFAMAGAVLAIIGLIVAIVEMFVVKPANPLDQFMSKTIIPFVDSLPAQAPPPTPGGKSISIHSLTGPEMAPA